MAISWEIDIFFERDGRDPEADEDFELEADHYYGRPVYRATVEADSFEHGSSGTLALYYKEEDTRENVPSGQELMKRSVSIKDPDMVAVEATRIGDPDEPEIHEDEVDEEEWSQETQ